MMSNKNINVPNELILMILENVLLVTQKITIKRLLLPIRRLFLPIKKQRNFGTLKDVFFPYLLMKIKLSKGGF